VKGAPGGPAHDELIHGARMEFSASSELFSGYQLSSEALRMPQRPPAQSVETFVAGTKFGPNDLASIGPYIQRHVSNEILINFRAIVSVGKLFAKRITFARARPSPQRWGCLW
jgi:hypothetical protein